ncbi:hypothetical protein ACLIA0_07180 [Bacillaceae bacterium W0354]
MTEANEAVYFVYDDGGEEWLQFARQNVPQIISAFIKDLKQQTTVEIYHEWFSINGGQTFSQTRLGYYIGYVVLKRLIKKYGEEKAITIWKEKTFTEEIDKILVDLANK